MENNTNQNHLTLAMEHLLTFIKTAKEDIPKNKNLTDEQKVEFEKQWEASTIPVLIKEINEKAEQYSKKVNV